MKMINDAIKSQTIVEGGGGGNWHKTLVIERDKTIISSGVQEASNEDGILAVVSCIESNLALHFTTIIVHCDAVVDVALFFFAGIKDKNDSIEIGMFIACHESDARAFSDVTIPHTLRTVLVLVSVAEDARAFAFDSGSIITLAYYHIDAIQACRTITSKNNNDNEA